MTAAHHRHRSQPQSNAVNRRAYAMRFRGRISNDKLLTLHAIIATFEKIGGRVVMLLDEEVFRLSLVKESIESPRCYAELNVAELFTDYKIQSQTQNTILFEMSLHNLSQAFSSGKAANQCQLKLVKRNSLPCLCFETKANESSLSVDVVHDIPVVILRFSDTLFHTPPEVSPPTVALDLPTHNRLMKTVVDRMTRLNKHTQMTASQNGHIVFRTAHTSADISTHFSGLRPRFVGDLVPAAHMDNQATVKLLLRGLGHVLNLFSLHPECVSIFVTADEVVLFHVNLSPQQLGSVTYYLPVIVLDEGEEAAAAAGAGAGPGAGAGAEAGDDEHGD